MTDDVWSDADFVFSSVPSSGFSQTLRRGLAVVGPADQSKGLID
jgi:hypothetical protein